MCRTSGRIHEEISEKFPEEIKIILKHILEFSDFFFSNELLDIWKIFRETYE